MLRDHVEYVYYYDEATGELYKPVVPPSVYDPEGDEDSESSRRQAEVGPLSHRGWAGPQTHPPPPRAATEPPTLRTSTSLGVTPFDDAAAAVDAYLDGASAR